LILPFASPRGAPVSRCGAGNFHSPPGGGCANFEPIRPTMENEAIPVLIVDDDRTTAFMLRGLLGGLGSDYAFAVTVVDSGAAARAEFQRGVHRLVLLDYLLPDEDGLGLLAALNLLPAERRPVVIMLTGAGSEEVAVEAMKLGARDYVVKSALNLATLRRAIAGALERARLEERLAESTAQLRRQHAEIEADLKMARVVQQALLPQTYPVFPPGVPTAQSQLRFEHRWLPSHQVAGDFFTVFPLSDHAAGLFLCDVMGHGVRAALITTHLRGVLREQQTLAADPGSFLTNLNQRFQSLLTRVGDLVFVTAVYAVADYAAGELRLAVAGHPAPLRLRRRAAQVELCALPDGPGPALGLMAAFSYDTVRVPLAPGDGVLFYTDGVYEVNNPEGEDFGQERLREAVAARLDQPTGALLDGLLEAVRAHRQAGAAAMPDDICLLVVDRAPEA
jgi:serine phosphatase RsbU (regulator of sigma subunit)